MSSVEADLLYTTQSSPICTAVKREIGICTGRNVGWLTQRIKDLTLSDLQVSAQRSFFDEFYIFPSASNARKIVHGKEKIVKCSDSSLHHHTKAFSYVQLLNFEFEFDFEIEIRKAYE